MPDPVKVHPVPRRGEIEYYLEIPCPECAATVFVLEDDPTGPRFDDLTIFGRHACRVEPLINRPDDAPAGLARPVIPAAGFPVDLGRIPDEAAREFRSAIEAPFGKRLTRFTGVFGRKGLPIHFTPEWGPRMSHVPSFSKSDVHREIAGTSAILLAALSHLKRHFSQEPAGSHRKFFFSAKGVFKHDRSGSKPVIVWKWPARY